MIMIEHIDTGKLHSMGYFIGMGFGKHPSDNFLLKMGYRRVEVTDPEPVVEADPTLEDRYEILRTDHEDTLRLFRSGWNDILYAHVSAGGAIPTELSFYEIHLICDGLGEPWISKYKTFRALWDDIIVKVGGNSADAYKFLPFIISDDSLVS